MTRLTITRSLATLFLALLLAACGSSRKMVGTGAYTAGTPALSWHDITVPVNISLSEPKRMSIGGTMTMVRDESVTISLRFLGMEVGAALISPDSLLAYSKLQKVYVAESLTGALAGVGLPLADLQSLLTGQPFESFMSLPALSTGGELDIEARVTESTGQPLALSVSQPNTGRSVNIDFTPLGDGAPLASALDFSVTLPSAKSALPTRIAATLTYSWDRATIDSSTPVRSFSIPSTYRRIPGTTLLKSLTNL